MSPPDNASLEALSLAEVRDLVGALVAKVADLGAANAALKAENQARNYPPPLHGSGLADSILACSGTRLSG